MSIPSAESTEQANLRLAAEARLKEGTAPPTRGWPTGVSALNLLHRLASTPGSADDALKLLHELQVHQIELDLQQEQMEMTQRELAEDLGRYRAFYESAPVPYLSLGLGGEILEGNLAAAGLLGATPDELRGRPFEGFLAVQSRWVLAALLKRLRAGGSTEACEVRSSSASSAHSLQLLASLAPGGGSVLAVLVDTAGLRPPGPRI